MWPAFFHDAEAIVFVVDAVQTMRIGLVRDELQAITSHPDVKSRRTPILLFLNKMDSEPDHGDKLSVQRLERVLQLQHLQVHHAVHVQPSSGATGAGVDEGFRWLADTLRQQKRGR